MPFLAAERRAHVLHSAVVEEEIVYGRLIRARLAVEPATGIVLPIAGVGPLGIDMPDVEADPRLERIEGVRQLPGTLATARIRREAESEGFGMIAHYANTSRGWPTAVTGDRSPYSPQPRPVRVPSSLTKSCQ